MHILLKLHAMVAIGVLLKELKAYTKETGSERLCLAGGLCGIFQLYHAYRGHKTLHRHPKRASQNLHLRTGNPEAESALGHELGRPDKRWESMRLNRPKGLNTGMFPRSQVQLLT